MTSTFPNAPTFISSSGNITDREPIGAAVIWEPDEWPTKGEAGIAQRTPNLAPLIDEIVKRAGWSSGNALVILISGTGERVAEPYNGDADAAPLLHVEFIP